MTLNEFRAWLEGYEASIRGAPTPEQWAAIKAKLAAVGQIASGPSVVAPLDRTVQVPSVWGPPWLTGVQRDGNPMPAVATVTFLNSDALAH